LGPGKLPAQKFEIFSSVHTHAESDSRLLFQKWSKSVQDKWPKSRVALITKKTKHVLAPWGGTPGAISPIFLV